MEERCFFFDPFKEELIIGAKRLKSFAAGDSYQDYDFIFSTRTFFKTIKDPKWAGFGNETLAFQYYLVVREGKQLLYHWQDPVEVEEREIAVSKLQYQYKPDDYEQWRSLFNKARQQISAGEVTKVVISREVKIECETAVNVAGVIRNLWEQNQNSFIFAYSKDSKTFLGATPEILVQRKKGTVISYALAGTISRDLTGRQEDEKRQSQLLHDAKNRFEHQIVVDAIAGKLETYLGSVQVGPTKILTLRNLHHLQTRIYGKNDCSTLEDWVARLHPTPALGGYPVEKALAIIDRSEEHERGLYAAPIGMMNGQGDGIFVAGIRSALIMDNTVFAYTGCGIIKDSECESEYLETDNKVRTMLDSL